MAKKKMVTPEFRASFVYLTTPHAAPGSDKEKYSLNVVIQKDNKEQMAFLKKLKAEIAKLRDEKFGEPDTWTKKQKVKYKQPIKDGDDEDIPQWEDCFVFIASSDRQPDVVDTAFQDVIDPDALYSGAWYRVSVSLYSWSHESGNFGVSASLSNVMFVRDDDAFDGRTSAQQDFADVDYADEMEDDDDVL